MSSESGSEGGTGGTEAREHLANERTLLSWVRTGVSLISFGLVIARLGAQLGPATPSEDFGIALAGLGCLTLVMGTVQFLHSRRMISTGSFTSTVVTYMVVVAASLVLAGAFIVYTLVSSV